MRDVMKFESILQGLKNEMKDLFQAEDDYEGPDYDDPYYKAKLDLNIRLIDLILWVADAHIKGKVNREEYIYYKSEALETIFSASGCALDYVMLERYKYVLMKMGYLLMTNTCTMLIIQHFEDGYSCHNKRVNADAKICDFASGYPCR
jgi:hypothetical protein